MYINPTPSEKSKVWLYYTRNIWANQGLKNFFVSLCSQRANHIINTLKQYNIKRCFYGHLHGKTINYAFNGVSDGIKYKLISADAIDFCPYIID